MYAEEGAAGVAFADIDLEAAERAAKESVGMARNPDYRAISIPVDVTHEAEVWNMVEKTRREFGRIDYAVNCAGVRLVRRSCCFFADDKTLSRLRHGSQKNFRT